MTPSTGRTFSNPIVSLLCIRTWLFFPSEFIHVVHTTGQRAERHPWIRLNAKNFVRWRVRQGNRSKEKGVSTLFRYECLSALFPAPLLHTSTNIDVLKPTSKTQHPQSGLYYYLVILLLGSFIVNISLRMGLSKCSVPCLAMHSYCYEDLDVDWNNTRPFWEWQHGNAIFALWLSKRNDPAFAFVWSNVITKRPTLH